MAAIGWLRARYVELAWLAFAAANLAAMLLWPSWETIPFHFIWISLTLVYGFRVWTPGATGLVLGLVILATGSLILSDAFHGEQLWGELFEVPLMSAMFLAMVWHARRRQDTLRILERLLLLAKSKQPDFVVPEQVEIEPFLEDVLVRWSGIVPRGWRLGELSPGMLHADPEALRIALDALLENAVKYTEPADGITLSARGFDHSLLIEVADEGQGLPEGAARLIFDRFARADSARSRAQGGAGLGLAIVDAIVKAHGGECSARNSAAGAVFTLRLPDYARSAAAGSVFRAGPAVPS